jgi:anti-sigma factor RsiW
MNAPTITDSQLSAWLDQQLEGDERARAEAWLRDHPEDAARVRLWSADAEALRARLDAVLAEPVPARLEQAVWRRGPARGARFAGWQRWAASLAIFALGGVLGAGLVWRGGRPAAPLAAQGNGQGWVQRAAVAHSVYVPEMRHPVEVKAQEEHLARWLTKRLEMPVRLFDLRSQGFELVGGRLLPDAKGPSAQLMYQALGEVPSGQQPLRVTVYLRKPEDGTPAAFRFEQQGKTGLFYWVEGASPGHPACGYAIVGELPKERLLAIAEAIERQDAADTPPQAPAAAPRPTS